MKTRAAFIVLLALIALIIAIFLVLRDSEQTEIDGWDSRSRVEEYGLLSPGAAEGRDTKLPGRSPNGVRSSQNQDEDTTTVIGPQLSDDSGGDRSQGSPGVMARESLRLRIRTTPELDVPGIVNKYFAPGKWLEVSVRIVAPAKSPAGYQPDQFDLSFTMQSQSGFSLSDSLVGAPCDGEARFYLSPHSLGRFTGKQSPILRDLVWVRVVDNVSGNSVSTGSPPESIPESNPDQPYIHVLAFEDTPFSIHDRKDAMNSGAKTK